jgi:hypothetical protein
MFQMCSLWLSQNHSFPLALFHSRFHHHSLWLGAFKGPWGLPDTDIEITLLGLPRFENFHFYPHISAW